MSNHLPEAAHGVDESEKQTFTGGLASTASADSSSSFFAAGGSPAGETTSNDGSVGASRSTILVSAPLTATARAETGAWAPVEAGTPKALARRVKTAGLLLTTTSERQGRLIDHDQAGSMEKKKKEGYF
jgi:3'-phosphoadenosine 5'-phosphosulfate sulfotransferase (PAPS reductase)/FAD synthetase